MSNKETLQQHNTRLSENNIDLNTILNKVKELSINQGEDLITELTEQDNLLTTQKISLEDVKRALQNKIGGSGGISPTVEGNTLILSSGKIEGGVLSV